MPKNFLKNIISIARVKLFLFLSKMEQKLIVIDPFIKFKTSISIESLFNKLDIKHISLNQNDITKS